MYTMVTGGMFSRSFGSEIFGFPVFLPRETVASCQSATFRSVTQKKLRSEPSDQNSESG